MGKMYKVVFVYPDGHIEEIEELFNAGKDALEYGNSLLAQVRATEGVFNRHQVEDIFAERQSSDPYFMIIELVGKKYHMVYDSRSR